MTWQLIEAEETECTMDDSGVYTVINRCKPHVTGSALPVSVRADLMTTDNEPIVSFVGSANAVRKALIRFVWDQFGEREIDICISHEHASYIGYELMRAESDPDYVQD